MIKENFEPKILSFKGGLEICFSKRKVLLKEREILLTAKEFEILYFLASYPDFVFTHKQIYEEVWNEEYVHDDANITSHISHIRRKIEPDPNHPVYIQTVRGVGYKFVKQ